MNNNSQNSCVGTIMEKPKPDQKPDQKADQKPDQKADQSNHTDNTDHTSNANTMKIDLVIYHGGCPDGIAGAWAFWNSVKDPAKFHPGKFGESPPDVTDKNVVFVDFTYRKAEMEKLLKSAASILVLDHHKTATDLISLCHPKFTLVLDMNRSGAQIAWDYMNTNMPRPWFVEDIADRDLWKWAIPDSKCVTRALLSLGYYESIEKFNTLLFDPLYRNMLIPIGKVLLNEDDKIYKILQNQALDCMCVSPKDPRVIWKVRTVGTSGNYASEIGNLLTKDGLCDFAAVWRYSLEHDEWWISLRANPASSIDLTEVCKHFDQGGGHPKAAGITLSKGQHLSTYFHPVPSNERFHITAYANLD
jgi:hypothetical protein